MLRILKARLLLPLTAVTLFVPSAYADDSSVKPVLGLMPVKYPIDAGEIVGPLKIGTLCLPHGKIRWGDLRVPSEFESRSLIIASLAEGGIIARNAEDISELSIPILSLRITAASLRLCIPGISGVIGKPKAAGSIHLIWQVRGSLSYDVEMDIPMAASSVDPRTSSLALDQALKEGARRFLAAAPSH